MIMKKLLFLILFNFIYIINAQLKYEIINLNTPSQLIKYPTPINYDICNFEIHLMVVNILDQTGPPFSMVSGVDYVFALYKNETSAIFSIVTSTLNGTFLKDISILSYPEYSIKVNCTCDYVDTKKLSVEFVDQLSFNEMNYYSTIFKINGLLRPIVYDVNNGYKIKHIPNTELYTVQFTPDYFLLNPMSNWEVSIKFSDGQYLVFNVTYNNGTTPTVLNENLIDINYFPNENTITTSNGYGKLQTFKVVTKIEPQPLFLMKLSVSGNTFYRIAQPILGSSDNVTFIIPFLIASSGSSFYSFYIQDGQPSFSQISYINDLIIFNVGGDFSNLFSYTIDNETIPMYTSNIVNNENYGFKIFKISSNPEYGHFQEGFPFGFSSGNNLMYNLSYSILSIYDYSLSDIQFFINAPFSILIQKSIPAFKKNGNNGTIDISPSCIDVNSIYLGEFKFLVQISAKSNDQYGINTIKISGDSEKLYKFLSPINLVSGTLLNGIWEFVYNAITSENTPQGTQIYSFTGLNGLIVSGNPISIENPSKLYQLPSINLNNFNIDNLVNISFLYNNVDITNQTVSNIMYFNFTNIEDYKDISVAFNLLDSKTFKDSNFDYDLNKYDHSLYEQSFFAERVNGRYQVFFKIPANTMPGIANYYLTFSKELKIFNSAFPQSAQLNLISKNIDIYGPIFSKIIKNPSNLPQDTFGWLVTIEDNVNGLKNGYITVRGTIDSSLHNFTIEPSKAIKGDKWVGEYEIYIKEHQSQCIHQSYEITDVVLYDTFNNKAIYDKNFMSGTDNIKNPFIYYLNDTMIFTLTPINICYGIPDTSAPMLLSFKSSTPSLDVGSLNGRNITFEFESQDQQTGIRENQFPIVYLTTLNLDIHKCISTNSTPFQTTTKFTCTTTVPIGFGYPTGIIFSVYGFINNGGYYSGYSTQSLKDSGFDYSLNTTIYTENQPIITSTNSITNYGGSLMIYGRKLAYGNIGDIQSILVLLKYSDDGNGGIYISFTPKTIYDSFILIEGIRATNQSFTIKITSSSTPIESNEFTVTPKLFFFNYTAPIEPTISPTTSPSSTPSSTPTTSPSLTPSVTPTTSPSLTPIPTVSPIPTNPPQKCQGNPECGGSNQGICKEGGCVCYPPFIGLTCTSQIIIVPQPSTNSTNPSTEIPIPPTDNSQDSEDISKAIFKSLISLVSLRELNFKGEETKLYTFDKWIFTPLNNNKHLYETSINSNLNTITNISATLEWFNKSTTVEFANQQLQMNPSSIKYTIEINEYPFSQSLNTLQLVMSASLISSETDDICSSKEFGNTTNGDDSNFLKIQVDNHSVYGRFIKRAIIDSKVQSIENVLLDSTMKPISTSHSTQSYIGITIPQYSKQVIIDPDFSIIIDQRAASSNSENSICSNNSSSLTGGQIAGIIIGGVAFLAVIIVCIFYFFYKNKKDKLLQQSMKRKLEKVG
ncbi:hypothetical protein ACTFIV_005022 [Dictyostelium citrinum]